MKTRILVARPIFPEVLERLARHFELRSNQDDVPWTPESWMTALSACQEDSGPTVPRSSSSSASNAPSA